MRCPATREAVDSENVEKESGIGAGCRERTTYAAVPVMAMGPVSTLDIAIFVPVITTWGVMVTHLKTRDGDATPSSHEPISTEIADLEGGKLSSKLPILRYQQY